METFIDIVLFGFLLLTAFAMMRLTNLFAVVMLSGVFSLLSAGLFVAMDAVDVAFTEAAVGAGITTVLMLTTMALTTREEKPSSHSRLLPMLLAFFIGAALLYATVDMPPFGSPETPANTYLSTDYIDRTYKDMGLPNIVTGILASYRGFDTLGEVVVVFVAGVGVICLLHGRTRPKSKPGKKGGGA